jgi:hypothetical protein
LSKEIETKSCTAIIPRNHLLKIVLGVKLGDHIKTAPPQRSPDMHHVLEGFKFGAMESSFALEKQGFN